MPAWPEWCDWEDPEERDEPESYPCPGCGAEVSDEDSECPVCEEDLW